MSNLLNPCIEFCYIRQHKQYDESCHSTCEYAKAVDELKAAKSAIMWHRIDTRKYNISHSYEKNIEDGCDLPKYEQVVLLYNHDQNRYYIGKIRVSGEDGMLYADGVDSENLFAISYINTSWCMINPVYT